MSYPLPFAGGGIIFCLGLNAGVLPASAAPAERSRGAQRQKPWQPKQKISGGYVVMSLKPLNDRVLVKRLESEEKTAGGLYIPDTAKEKPSRGEVIAAGPGKRADDGKLIPMAVKPGDLVLFNKYAGTEVKLDGVEHLVMREDDILAVIE